MKEVTAYTSDRGGLYSTQQEAFRDDVYVLLRKVLNGKEVLNIDTLLDNSVEILAILNRYK